MSGFYPRFKYYVFHEHKGILRMHVVWTRPADLGLIRAVKFSEESVLHRKKGVQIKKKK